MFPMRKFTSRHGASDPIDDERCSEMLCAELLQLPIACTPREVAATSGFDAGLLNQEALETGNVMLLKGVMVYHQGAMVMMVTAGTRRKHPFLGAGRPFQPAFHSGHRRRQNSRPRRAQAAPLPLVLAPAAGSPQISPRW